MTEFGEKLSEEVLGQDADTPERGGPGTNPPAEPQPGLHPGAGEPADGLVRAGTARTGLRRAGLVIAAGPAGSRTVGGSAQPVPRCVAASRNRSNRPAIGPSIRLPGGESGALGMRPGRGELLHRLDLLADLDQLLAG